MTLLRASSDQLGLQVDVATVLDPEAIGDAGVPAGAQLLSFVNAAHVVPGRLEVSREELRAIVGDGGLLEAAATVAIFNGLVRVADGTGIQLDAGVLADSADFRTEHGVDDYAGAANTETVPVTVDRNSVSDLFA